MVSLPYERYQDSERWRRIEGIPFEPIRIDPAALMVAGDAYAEATGDCDEIALGRAIEDYLEAERAA